MNWYCVKAKSKYLGLPPKALYNLDPNYYPLLILKYSLQGRKQTLLHSMSLCFYMFFTLIVPFAWILTTPLPFHHIQILLQDLAWCHLLGEFFLTPTLHFCRNTQHTFTEHLDSLAWRCCPRAQESHSPEMECRLHAVALGKLFNFLHLLFPLFLK